MKLERSKNAMRNASFGIINRLVGIICPFIVRTIFIKVLSVEYLGLNSLFSSILTVLNLTELGFSSAIVFCMYKPIADDDTDAINALLYFYKKAYKYIGIIIFTIGVCLIPFLEHLINGTYPNNINLVVVYLVYLFNTVLSYFLFGYLSSLISAFQREDLISKVSIITSLAMYGTQIITLILTRNYYVFLSIMLIFTVVNNLRTAIIAKKYFPQYIAKGELEKKYKKQIKEKVSGLIISKICSVSRNAFDSIFISMFLGLVDTAIYNNYYYIMNSIVAITVVITTSITAGAGNSVVTESEYKNYCDMNRMNYIYMWLAGWFTTCLLCLYQPFMKLWVGEKFLFPIGCVILICIYFYVLKMGDIRFIYDQAKGLWWENRYRALGEAIANITLNYILGKRFGIEGIILATLISLFVFNFCLGSQIIFKKYFINENVRDYYLAHFKYACTTTLVCGITFVICSKMPEGVLGIVIKFMICMILPNVLYLIIYKKQKIHKDSFNWLLNKLPIKVQLILNRGKGHY
ncbi:polysaccharide biosynthesis C-terminal domain-containing protein [Clostridium paraputrificum]|nr:MULTISPECIES: polysaccharide biosynthesis C-terminal domain-containing protein [Clostridium]MBS6888902.1 polysaccharide biosynthesis C-terminal domain-containing protein [Clostridium sp.]MDB2074989.1 polysaccharide biosynthesis C-terminal domain-containing protein [Clostridium paraputrificum]MDB2078228.1 polysaccharide biosynthesis C-terminal domain-containing protein [Clostridium paraputrificum]MDU2108055.1 polysaccharide biosynthesis C-terminal domain-containing protein [Clostridium sp.]M